MESPTSEEWAKVVRTVGSDSRPDWWDDDLVPRAPSSSDNLGDFVASIDIIDAYQTWCGKSSVDQRPGQTESIKVSCPNPAHPDKNPSAWINTDKQVWFCGACNLGGDAYDIAAYRFGYSDTYKHDGSFRRLVADMAESCGYQFRHGEDPRRRPAQDQPAEPPQPVQEEDQGGDTPSVAVVEPEPDPEPVEVNIPEGIDWDAVQRLPWEEIYHPDGFRYAFMVEATEQRLIPDEFFASTADTALGLATNRSVRLERGQNVYPNLYSVLVGGTGTGKSQSIAPLRQLIEQVCPWDPADGTGVKSIGRVGSGEMLIKEFDHLCYNAQKGFEEKVPVTAWVWNDELADLLNRQNRRGSILSTILMEMYSSVEGKVDTASLTGGSHMANQPFLSLTTTTQPMTMSKMLSEMDIYSGFLNRFVFYLGSDKDTRDYDPVVGDPPYSLPESSKRLKAIRTWGKRKYGALAWRGDLTKNLYRDIFRREGWDRVSAGNPMVARSHLLFLKLVLLNALDMQEECITEDNLYRAQAQIAYFNSTSLAVGGFVEYGEYDECGDRIVQALKALQPHYPDGVPEGKIREAMRRTKYIDSFEKVFSHLIRSNQIICKSHQPPRGRPTNTYKLKGFS